MECVVAKNDLFVDKNENPMDILGIGSNMVKALRYWLQAVGFSDTIYIRIRTRQYDGGTIYILRTEREGSQEYHILYAGARDMLRLSWKNSWLTKN